MGEVLETVRPLVSGSAGDKIDREACRCIQRNKITLCTKPKTSNLQPLDLKAVRVHTRLMNALIFSLICTCFFALAAREDPPIKRLTTDEAQGRCSRYEALLSNVDTDLSRWKQSGISLKLMQRTIAMHTTRKSGQKGFAAGFWKGKAYLLGRPDLTKVGARGGVHRMHQDRSS